MFYHDRCESMLYLNRIEGVQILVSIGIGQKTLKPGPGDIVIDKGEYPAQFYCSECKSSVDHSEVFIICMNCGHHVPLSYARRPSHSNGTYCVSCVEKFVRSGETALDLGKISQKISI